MASAWTPVPVLPPLSVISGPAACPAGCPPVLVQVVLEDVDVCCLLHGVWQSIVVLHYPMAEEPASFLIVKVPGSDGMVLSGMSGGGSPNPLPVNLHVKPGLHVSQRVTAGY